MTGLSEMDSLIGAASFFFTSATTTDTGFRQGLRILLPLLPVRPFPVPLQGLRVQEAYRRLQPYCRCEAPSFLRHADSVLKGCPCDTAAGQIGKGHIISVPFRQCAV